MNLVEPRYNEVPRDGQKFVRYNEVLLYRGKENLSLYRGLRYIEVRAGAFSIFPAATAPFPKSRASYCRFGRFNTSPLYYLRA